MLKTVGNPSTRYGDQTIDNGNLVIGTAGRGIDFSSDSHAAGMTSELFDDYEEGTFTPNQGGGLTVVGAFSSSGRYTKIGRVVTVTCFFQGSTSIAAAAGGQMCTNLPYSVVGQQSGTMAANTLATGGICAVYQSRIYACTAISGVTGIEATATYMI